MQTKAALMVLVLLSGTIAGCTSDPDGGGNDGIDSDALDELFDQYFEDFVNNTTITVNNHYYNNTTYVVDDGDYSTTVLNNNTTINEGDDTSTNNYNNQTDNDYSSSSLNYSINGSGDGSGSVVQTFRVIWNLDGRISPTNLGARELVINATVQVPGWTGSELSYQYNGNLIKLSFTCEEFINAYYHMSYSDWEDWIFGEYGGSQSQAQSLSYSIGQDISEIMWDNNGARIYCWLTSEYDPPTSESSYISSYSDFDTEIHYTTVFEIPLSPGQAIEFMSTPSLHNVTVDCDDGFSASTNSASSNNGSISMNLNNYPLIGGHAECIVRGNAVISTAHSYVLNYGGSGNWSNGSGSPPPANTPEWYDGGNWYTFTQLDYARYDYYPSVNTPFDFLVYFTMHFVQVYDHDSE